MEITFVLHLITVCAFLVVSLGLAFKFFIEAVIQYKSFTLGVNVVFEEIENDDNEEQDAPSGR